MTIPHLDDEALSAALDGESTVDQEAHLSTCGHCREELQSLAVVVRAVATPVAPYETAAVDAAIANALGALAPGVEPTTVRSGDGQLAPGLDARRVGARSGAEPVGDPVATPVRRRPARWVLAAMGAAATVVLVGGLVAVVGRSGSTSSNGPSTAAPEKATVSPSTSVPKTEFAGGAATPGDLGVQSDTAMVARLVTEAIGASSGDLAGGATPAAAAPSNTATSNTATSNTAALALPKAPCVAEAGAVLGIVGGGAPAGGEGLRYVATLSWRGQAAIVVVFSAAGRLSGAIMKTVDCSLLAVLPL